MNERFDDASGNRRAALAALAALGGLLAVTVAAALVLGAFAGKRFRSDKGAPYPYAWTEKRDGTIALELNGAKAPNGVWTAESPGNVVEVSLGETSRGRAKAVLTPVGPGRAALSFTLIDAGERIGEATFVVEADGENGRYAATVVSHRETFWQARVSGGSAAYPFTVEASDLGDLAIRITDAEIGFGSASEEAAPEVAAPEVAETSEEAETSDEKEGVKEDIDWRQSWEVYSSDETVVGVLDKLLSPQGIDIFLEGRASGTATVTVSKPSANVSHVFTLERSGYNLVLTDSRTQSYTPPVSAAVTPPPSAEASEAAETPETPDANASEAVEAVETVEESA